MHPIDWLLLIGSLVFIVGYGLWKSRHINSVKSYLLADRSMRWYTVLFSVMATQASAITFLSTPGQAFVDGLRFVQFYFGLPLAMIVLSITFVPIYHRLQVYTAYEFLETRFDLKTRLLAASLFLIQRGLAAGLTIYAPSIILSQLLGWNLFWTNLLMGGLVIIYTAAGGNKAVSWTHLQQMIIILSGMVAAFLTVLWLLPKVSLYDTLTMAGAQGKLQAIDFSFDPNNRYTLWSGLLGGFFLQLSYFGTDQSQVARYLTGASVEQSRLGLLFNGLLKVPMQFFILLLGVFVYVFFQFNQPPIFFNSNKLDKARNSAVGAELQQLEYRYQSIFRERQQALTQWLEPGQHVSTEAKQTWLRKNQEMTATRDQAIAVMQKQDPAMDRKDTNYIFLFFVIHYLPIGLVGLVMAAIIAASMSSTAAELNALSSTSVVDVYKRIIKPHATEKATLTHSILYTVFWGGFAIAFAEYASRLGSLIEAVNILGSLFYGTILGLFLAAFYFRRIRGHAVFWAALTAEAIVLCCFFLTDMSFLWYNVIGCGGVILFGVIYEFFFGNWAGVDTKKGVRQTPHSRQ
jgi:Na+/proline symporter